MNWKKLLKIQRVDEDTRRKVEQKAKQIRDVETARKKVTKNKIRKVEDVREEDSQFCICNNIFKKKSLADGKILVYECCKKIDEGSSVLQKANPKASFIFKITEAFKEIENNDIGKLMLKELQDYINLSANDTSNTPIIILPSNIIHLTANVEIGEKLPENIIDYFPEELQKILGSKENIEKIAQLSSSGSQFIPINFVSNDLKYNVVIIDLEVEKTADRIGFEILYSEINSNDKIASKQIKINSDKKLTKIYDYCIDIVLFHELNHCRHFLQKRETYSWKWGDEKKRIVETVNCSLVSAQKDNYSVNIVASSDGIMISSKKKQKTMMKCAEEELQLTGFTINESRKNIKDKINEISYSYSKIQKEKKDGYIRYPYEFNNPLLGNSQAFLSLKNVKKILRTALQQ